MIYIISTYIPDSWKTSAWLLWDRRETWCVCKAYYRDFQRAYESLRLHEDIIALVKKCKAEAA